MKEYEELFRQESLEIIKNAKKILLDIEKKSLSDKGIKEIFRFAHTLKGMAAAMGKKEMEEVCHKFEDYLTDVKKDIKKLDKDLVLYVLNKLEEYVKGKEIDFEELREIIEGVKTLKDVQRTVEFSKITEIKVSTDKLDKFLNSVQKLIIIREKLKVLNKTIKSEEISDTITEIDRIGQELYNEVLGLRLIKFSDVVIPFKEFVMSEAKRLGKKVRFEVEGEEVEIDRSIFEEMREPLLHLLRNAIVHGIEEPEIRLRCGKDEYGLVKLKIKREKEEVFIEVVDDGKGVDVEEIKKRAVELGFVDREKVAKMSEDEVLDILTYAGFSSLREVKKVGGRGIGLDIVKKLALKYGGNLKIKTIKGKGTTFIIRLPLTFAMIRILLIGVNGDMYGIPVSYIGEILRKEEYKKFKLLGYDFCEYNNQLLPVFHLGGKLGYAIKGGNYGLVISGGGDRGVVEVEEIYGDEHVTVSSLPSILRGKEEIIGVGLKSDGTPIVIIDPMYLIKLEE